MNMAIDEALLEHCDLARLCASTAGARPSLSFGYFGKFADSCPRNEDRELVRRWTGGGSVPHGQDLTYSLVTPASDPASGRAPPSSSMPHSHTAIRRGAVGRMDRRPNWPTAARPENLRRLFCQSRARRSNLPRPQNRRGGPAPNTRRLSPSGQHSVARICPELFATDSRPLFQRRSSMKKSRRKSSNAPSELAGERYGTEAWLRRW